MASIIDTYTARRYYQLAKDQQHLMIPKYIKPSKENLSKSVQNESKITRPIALIKKSNSETQDLNSSTTTTNNLDFKLKVRLLIFVEDSDGSRSNIFDSEKCQTSNNTTHNVCNSPKKLNNSTTSRSMPKTTTTTTH